MTTLAVAASLVALVGLSACTTLSPAGLLAASRLDPLNTPPASLRLAVGVPRTVRLSSGDATLRIALHDGERVLVDETVPLRVEDGGGEAPRRNAESEHVYVASLAPEDAIRFASAQQRVRRLRASGTRGTGSLSVSVTGGCHVGAAPEELPVSTWLREASGERFVPLTRRSDVFGSLPEDEADRLRAQLDPC